MEYQLGFLFFSVDSAITFTSPPTPLPNLLDYMLTAQENNLGLLFIFIRLRPVPRTALGRRVDSFQCSPCLKKLTMVGGIS